MIVADPRVDFLNSPTAINSATESVREINQDCCLEREENRVSRNKFDRGYTFRRLTIVETVNMNELVANFTHAASQTYYPRCKLISSVLITSLICPERVKAVDGSGKLLILREGKRVENIECDTCVGLKLKETSTAFKGQLVTFNAHPSLRWQTMNVLCENQLTIKPRRVRFRFSMGP